MKRKTTVSGPASSAQEGQGDGIHQPLRSGGTGAAASAMVVPQHSGELAPETIMSGVTCAEGGTNVCSKNRTSGKSVSVFPGVLLERSDPGDDTGTRQGVIDTKRSLESLRQMTFKETKGVLAGAEKNALYAEIRGYAEEAARLERHLEEDFVPIHGPGQFLSPRAFFVSPLFRVRNRNELRQKHLELELPAALGKLPIRYSGPELRQSDGLVFLALIHMLRDVRAGAAVSLHPEAVCMALFKRYDGNARRQLREHIQRLQQGLLIFDTFSVQLCQRFDYPKTGPWTVGLDKHITKLFAISPAVWLELEGRLSLPEGLATWLFSFVASQTRLIPMPLTTLKALCGSQATDKAFSNRMRDALKQLAQRGVIDTGWSAGNGQVRWRKLSKS